jgi:hypothetical protein
MMKIGSLVTAISAFVLVISPTALAENKPNDVPHILIALNKINQSSMSLSQRFSSRENCENAKKWWQDNAGPIHYTRSECFPE